MLHGLAYEVPSPPCVVSVQFDTKLPQFGTSEDLEDFLRAPLIQKLYPQILGGPFFTSVPCGRVGIGKDSTFISNEVSCRICTAHPKNEAGTNSILYVSSGIRASSAESGKVRPF